MVCISCESHYSETVVFPDDSFLLCNSYKGSAGDNVTLLFNLNSITINTEGKHYYNSRVPQNVYSGHAQMESSYNFFLFVELCVL